jgi:trimeric autotransporter adhesin
MVLNYSRNWLRYLVLGCLAVVTLPAAEYRGTVQSKGMKVPGATVTAVQGEQKLTTTTDDKGVFQFLNLPDGAWQIQVEMLGFEPLTRQIDSGSPTPAVVWDLNLMSEDALIARLDRAPQPAALVVASSAKADAGKPEQPLPAGAAAGQPPLPADVRPQASTVAEAAPAPVLEAAKKQSRSGKKGKSGATTASASNRFQQLAVSQSAATATLESEGTIKKEEIADLSQSAANSFIVQGSMSSALGLPSAGDWGPGSRMGDPSMNLSAAGASVPEMDGANGDGPGNAQTSMRAGGLGGPGGGGPPGGGGGPGGGGPPPGGGGPGGGGGDGPGGPGGGMGGPPPGWQGKPNAMAFGNGRKDPRNMYMAMASFSLDNSIWDARSYSVTGSTVDKPAYANARGSLMLGGPLQIPKLLSAERRIFFSFNLQIQNNRTGSISDPVNMPTTLERQGNFSQSSTQSVIYDPASGTPFANNVIPVSRVSSTATSLLKYYPQPNLPYATQNYQTSWTGKNNSHNLNSRVSNVKIGSKDRLNFSFGYQGSSSVTPNLFAFTDTGSGRGINASLGWSHNFTSRLTNNLQYTFSRMRQLSSSYFANRENVASELGIAGTSQDPLNWGPPSLSFTNYASLTDGTSSLNRNQNGSVSEGLIWVHGRSSFSFGGDYRRQQANQLSDPNGRGTYTFNGAATSLLVDGVAQSDTGYDMADFLLGSPTTSSLRYGNAEKYLRGTGYSFYVNDDWRISSRFSLVLGLRYEYSSPMTELYNRLVNLDISPGFTAIQTVTPGETGSYSGSLPDSLIRPDRNNFSPRVGFAWRPLAKDSLVVRGGYGIYYNTSVYNLVASNMAQQPPFAQVLSVSSTTSNPLTLENGFTSATSETQTSTYAIDPNYRVGYAQTWNFSLQHDLPFSLFATAGYLGTKGTRLDQQFLPNSVAPGLTASTLPTGYTFETSNGDSIYHAAQFQLNRRFHGGLMTRASYQFSKSIDNAGTGGRGQGNTPVAQNWEDLSAERGLSSFDARHNLTVNFQYSSGMGMSGGTLLNGWKGALLKDWTLGGSISLKSGLPFTATIGGNRSQVSGTAVSNTVRADSTGDSVKASGLLFNTAAFTEPAAGTWGNAGRNTIPGPTTFNLNGTFGRIFRFGERRSADLQVQAQNLLNRVTITNWGTVLGSSTYGLASSAATMRKVTVELRFRF